MLRISSSQSATKIHVNGSCRAQMILELLQVCLLNCGFGFYRSTVAGLCQSRYSFSLASLSPCCPVLILQRKFSATQLEFCIVGSIVLSKNNARWAWSNMDVTLKSKFSWIWLDWMWWRHETCPADSFSPVVAKLCDPTCRTMFYSLNTVSA